MASRSSQAPVHFGKVVVSSGHMIDAPDRAVPRFPESKAELVREEIARQLEQWEIGSNDLAICGGACGADIIFAEECLRRGAALRLLLAREPDAFVRDSVVRAGDAWVRRFHLLRERCEIEILPDSQRSEASDLSIYARTNLWMIETAQHEAGEGGQLCALLVWDERSTGDGPGGTSDFADRVRNLGGNVAIINPAKLSD